jgi:glycosyltransferase involved in cell wall biosynthesis
MSARGVKLHVITGRPAGAVAARDVDMPPGVELSCISLDVWRTTDRYSSHEAFARGATDVLQRLVDGPDELDAVMLVDWTAAAAIDAMSPAARAQLPPVFFLNFRVYARMTDISDEDRAWYHAAETRAIRYAIDTGGAVVSLCDADDEALRTMYKEGLDNCANAPDVRSKLAGDGSFRVVLPMLRDEFSQIARRNKGLILDPTRVRMFFVCLVRLSEDKGPQRFVDVCEAMTRADANIWNRTGVVPLMAGAASQPEFADALKARFKDVVPCSVVVDDFLNSTQLATILMDAVLNIHPALYEAYGMTIVEAGSCGVPSVTNNVGIGAAQLLNPESGMSIPVDMADTEAVAKQCASLLENSVALAEVGRSAYTAATSWTETEHVGALLDLVDERLRFKSRQAPIDMAKV